MITVHVIVRSDSLEGESTRSFKMSKSGVHRGVESYLRKVKQMYRSAVKERRGNTRETYNGHLRTDRMVPIQKENGFMRVTISECDTQPSLFPYSQEEITKLQNKYAR